MTEIDMTERVVKENYEHSLIEFTTTVSNWKDSQIMKTIWSILFLCDYLWLMITQNMKQSEAYIQQNEHEQDNLYLNKHL